MFTVRLRENIQKLSYNENLLANYILSNRQSISSMTSYDIAKKAGIAQTSVIRFAKKIGYNSFKDLQLDLMMDENNYGDGCIDPQESTNQTYDRLKDSYRSTLEEVLRFNNLDKFDEVAKVLYDAKKIVCYGYETSYVIAKLFSDHMLEIGKDSLAFTNSFECVGSLRNMKNTDIIFLVSASGETKETIQIAKAAEKYGVTIVSLTGSHDSTLKNVSSYSLITSDYKIYTDMLNITNRCSQMFIVEMLFLLIWKYNPKEFEKNIQDMNFDLDTVAGWPMKKETSKYKGRKNLLTDKRYI